LFPELLPPEQITYGFARSSGAKTVNQLLDGQPVVSILQKPTTFIKRAFAAIGAGR
jgi:hypothetical protein